ncbi:MAG: hypothetical protein AUJ34_02945 [Parcubacteria group bacterium CG1_02_41_12]|nr:MAG: hypothetical protein AUJ34_02945 [Parcubacteria group bacterium CG1_02_41_12]PIP67394.1 MAG: hypothetical protein COW93_00300 [Parcubacteria group bacterium CG22_combo_CG10-13_8_21_14_all_41_9]
MKSSFDQQFIEQQKQSLLKEKQELEQYLKKLSHEKPEIKGDYKADYQEYGSDEESNAQEYAQTETNIGVVEQLEDKLNLVNAALERIKKGTYGIDSATGKSIDKRRLEANPSAEHNI